MSASLLRRGLELLEAPGRGKAPGMLQRGPGGPQAAGAARRKKAAPGSGRSKATVKGKVVKSAIEEYCKKKAVDHLRKNLQYMTNGRFVADKAVTQQLRAEAQRGFLLLQGEGRVLAELFGLLALFPALRHWLSILQQKIEVAELGKREGAILQYSSSTHSRK
ncbi:active regulator of SIRT1 isoform X1 [Apteryx rowi]|uniref:active regulator of SIRT1 isoform X1 n=1 Tax=Apteryx rowi TaxID=308060 RepID=UPI000E1CF96F|nr:active regulator of SIRT1 isoform X1 [Apteryx rowi]